MLDSRLLKTLRFLHGKLDKTDIDWALTGSCAFAIRGLPFKPNDIDIQTDKPGAYEIEKRLKKYVVEKVRFKESEKINSYFGSLEINEVKVEIMGDIRKLQNDGAWDEPVSLSEYKEYIQYEGMNIPVLSLEYEYQAYLKLGRFEKAEIIKKALNKSAE